MNLFTRAGGDICCCSRANVQCVYVSHQNQKVEGQNLSHTSKPPLTACDDFYPSVFTPWCYNFYHWTLPVVNISWLPAKGNHVLVSNNDVKCGRGSYFVCLKLCNWSLFHHLVSGPRALICKNWRHQMCFLKEIRELNAFFSLQSEYFGASEWKAPYKTLQMVNVLF